jgi:hypothetical protein
MQTSPSDFGSGRPARPAAPPTATDVASPPPESEGHGLECAVLHRLRSEPGLEFGSLVVRRVEGGVCLEGELRHASPDAEICDLARQVAGVNRVLDRMLRSGIELPE